ncbi:MAG: hypothetical protein ACO1N9_14605 [Flavobacterium sp.]
MRRISFLLAVTGLLASCSVENINYITPVMVTYEPQNVQRTSASVGGMVLGEGGKDVIEYGLVWGTAQNPTTADNKIAIGSRLGEFYNNYELFAPETTYYYRTYGTSEVGTGYGETYSFTTQGLPACNPTQNNRITPGQGAAPMTVYDVLFSNDFTVGDGNIQFETSANSPVRIYLSFNEINRRLPLSGTYTTVDTFDSLDPLSDGKVEMLVYNFGAPGAYGGGKADTDQKIYVENNNGVLTFIFCDVVINEVYTINGKFTYTP